MFRRWLAPQLNVVSTKEPSNKAIELTIANPLVPLALSVERNPFVDSPEAARIYA